MFDFVEPRVRRVVAEQLGVNVEELTPDVSLTDDLAADSLDLLELTLALEAEFGIVVSESALERVRTYGDLRATVHALLHQRHEAGVRAGVTPLEGWARVVSSRGAAGGRPGRGRPGRGRGRGFPGRARRLRGRGSPVRPPPGRGAGGRRARPVRGVREPHAVTSARARANTASSIGRVSFPVNVFC